MCNVDRYNVLTGEWASLDVVQEEHCYSDHSAVAGDDGIIYIFGGYNSEYLAMDTVVKVEVSGDNLTFSTSTPMGLVSCSCTLLDEASELSTMLLQFASIILRKDFELT